MNFKQLIEKHRFNRATLAKELNLTRSTVAAWVRGKSEPNITTIQKISELLNEPVETVVKALMACKGK